VAPRAGTQSIDRAARLLIHVVESEQPATVTELAQATGLPKSTASRLVGALERQGLVQRDPGRGSVRPGPVLVRYAQREPDDQDLVELTAPVLDRIAAETGETVNLAVAAPLGVEQLDQRDSRHFLGSTNWVGRSVPFHCSASGKVFLAFESVPVPPQLERLTAKTVVDQAELERQLEAVRERGFATAVDELETGLWAVGAPVAGATGVLAAISVSGPTTRLRRGLLEQIGRLIVREAAGLSARLGNDGEEGVTNVNGGGRKQ
jgi:IclR family transcriptional regulator, acetate operon repressor